VAWLGAVLRRMEAVATAKSGGRRRIIGDWVGDCCWARLARWARKQLLAQVVGWCWWLLLIMLSRMEGVNCRAPAPRWSARPARAAWAE
jgi:hypothetical protein